MTLSISNAAAIDACDAIVDLCDAGTTNPQATLVIYSGTPPANVDTALSGNTVLAQLAMSNPAFGPAADAAPGATATAGAIADDTSADATGTATFFRILDRDNTPVIQGTAGDVGTEELVLNSADIQSGAAVVINSLTVTMPEA